MKAFLLALILGGILVAAAAFGADLETEVKNLKEEMKVLKETIQELRRLIQDQELIIRQLKPGEARPPGKASPAEKALERELEEALKERKPPAPTPAPATATGISREFNPAISVNGLFLGAATTREREKKDGIERGIQVQEIEVQFTGFVDPYLKGDLIVAIEEGKEFQLEEAYVTALQLPAGFGGRVGKFFGEFGKHNALHTHQFPFIDPPIVNRRIFGEDGLNEVGVEGSYLIPLPWFSEVKVQLLDGRNEALFDSPDRKDLAYLGHWKNLWDLTENSTLEVGGSYVGGKNAFERLSQTAGADLTLKWRPLAGPGYPALTWQTEYLFSRRETANGEEEKGGLYSLLQYRFARRWWAQGRFDYFGLPRPPNEGREWRLSGLLAFVPSEFSAVRLQYSLVDDPEIDRAVHQLLLQLNYTFGSHPAHKY